MTLLDRIRGWFRPSPAPDPAPPPPEAYAMHWWCGHLQCLRRGFPAHCGAGHGRMTTVHADVTCASCRPEAELAAVRNRTNRR